MATLRHTLPRMPRQHVIDQRLISDFASISFLPKRIENARIQADRDQLPRFIAKSRSSDSFHCAEVRS
jgi:hypothetical protein